MSLHHVAFACIVFVSCAIESAFSSICCNWIAFLFFCLQLMACLSVWRTNIQPLITVIQDLFLHHSMGSVADTELQERRTFSSHQTPPMAPPTATRPGFGGSIPFELSLTGQGVVCTLSFPDVGVWSANIQQPVLMYSYLLSSMALQMSVHDLKLTVCPKDARGTWAYLGLLSFESVFTVPECSVRL